MDPTSVGKAFQWRYAMCNELFEGWSLDKVASSVADMGYEGLELSPFTFCDLVTDLSAAERKKIRQTVRDTGLEVAGIHFLLARTPFRLNVPDPEMRRKAGAYLLDLIDFCADIGGEILVFGSKSQRDPAEGFGPKEAWDHTVEVMGRCGERASERGVFFCIEALGTPFITWMDDSAKMVQEVDHPGFQLMLDCKAAGQDERWPVSEQLQYVAPWLKHVHVNDPNLLGPGMGDLDFVPILAALQELGYSRWLSVEAVRFSLDPEWIARQSLANLRVAEPG